MKTFNKGDEVFSRSGEKGTYHEYVAHAGKHLVFPHYEHELEEFASDTPEMWREVFTSPPREVHEEGIAKLIEERQKLADEVKTLRDEKYKAENGLRDALERLRKNPHPDLSMIEDVLAGNITHGLRISGGTYDIIPWGTGFTKSDQEDERETGYKIRCLCLYADKNWRNERTTFEWRMYRYRDMSGRDSCEIIPFGSEEAALARAGELIAGHFKDWALQGKPDRQTDHSKFWILRSARNSALALGFPVPGDVQEACMKDDQNVAQSNLEGAARSLAQAQKYFDEKQAELAAIGAQLAKPA